MPCAIQEQIERNSKEQVRHRIHAAFAGERAHERINFGGLVAAWAMAKKMIRALRVPSYGSVHGQAQKNKADSVSSGVFSPSTDLGSVHECRFAAFFIPRMSRPHAREIGALTCRRGQSCPFYPCRQTERRSKPFCGVRLHAVLERYCLDRRIRDGRSQLRKKASGEHHQHYTEIDEAAQLFSLRNYYRIAILE